MYVVDKLCNFFYFDNILSRLSSEYDQITIFKVKQIITMLLGRGSYFRRQNFV